LRFCSEVAQCASTRSRPRDAGCWLFEGQAAREEGDMRVSTAFNRLLRLPGASVIDVSFGAEGVIVTVRLRRRRRVCSRCGQTGRQLEIHDRRVKRWRHLDLGANRCMIEAELRRLRCRDCGVHLEAGAVGAAGRSPHPRLR
jgi:zinc-finger of transposase IS204/IS1001/IS1096/IS1165